MKKKIQGGSSLRELSLLSENVELSIINDNVDNSVDFEYNLITPKN